jgi:hypothetical protein
LSHRSCPRSESCLRWTVSDEGASRLLIAHSMLTARCWSTPMLSCRWFSIQREIFMDQSGDRGHRKDSRLLCGLVVLPGVGRKCDCDWWFSWDRKDTLPSIETCIALAPRATSDGVPAYTIGLSSGSQRSAASTSFRRHLQNHVLSGS